MPANQQRHTCTFILPKAVSQKNRGDVKPEQKMVSEPFQIHAIHPAVRACAIHSSNRDYENYSDQRTCMCKILLCYADTSTIIANFLSDMLIR